MKLTAIIPVRNEEVFLANCLRSVSFADEVLVLDSGSTDSTVSIAKEFGARVVEYSWQGFRYAHNYGAQLAKNEWLLYVDADERVSKPLRQKILKILEAPESNAYQINRRNFIMGKSVSYGGWYPDRVTRLIKKNGLVDWVGELHEYPKIKGEIGKIDADLYHLTHRGIDWSLEKTRAYTKITAEILKKDGHPQVKVKNFFGSMVREFWFRAVKKHGWKDGFIGWVEILYQTFNAFLIQVQLWELQQKKTMEQKYKVIDEKISSEIK